MKTRLITMCAAAAILTISGVAQATITIDTVPVGNPGNAGQLSGAGAGGFGYDRICGSVSYDYTIGKYEVTAGQYTAFLNAVAKTDTYGLYNTEMWSSDYGCKIQQNGDSGDFSYTIAPDYAKRPVNFVSWANAARFANWLHNGQPTGEQNLSTTEDGAYYLHGATTSDQLMAVNRKSDWKWAIASEDEWYKAAYYDPKKTGGAGYWSYPTRSDTAPSNLLGTPTDPGNHATYWTYENSFTSPYLRTEVGEHENSQSAYGTFDQGGNVWEWTETKITDDENTLYSQRGGSYADSDGYLRSYFRSAGDPSLGVWDGVGFRVVSLAAGSHCPSADLSGDCFVDLDDLTLLADQWLTLYDSYDFAVMSTEWLLRGVSIPDITWVSISETGFTGQMSKYETTNAQYCQFLNAAMASGDITVSGSTVYGANGTNNGMDYVGSVYYNLAGSGFGLEAKINYSGGVFAVDSGFENYPVNFVSRYGATAFCAYYGWLLPTLAQWQAVADFNGSYTYGCGTTISSTRANYNSNVGTTSVVGAFGAYGYGMCDMAGNVFEWTCTDNLNNSYIFGGGWNSVANSCKISYLLFVARDTMAHNTGFRACRVAGIPEPDMTWTSIADMSFSGQISKYETTNAQYCTYLNDALASGDITVSGDTVLGAVGSNSGTDFAGSVYYNLAGPGGNADGIVDGGASRIHYTGSEFTVDSGFENHPVTYVTRPGAAAFCGYYGWRLPTRLEWQGVADYTGGFTYGCGTTINNTKANYLGSSHPFGTTAAGTFGIYGYGVCDMAGNVNEWTSSNDGTGNYSNQGGGWDSTADSCRVMTFPMIDQYTATYNLGFRPCR